MKYDPKILDVIDRDIWEETGDVGSGGVPIFTPSMPTLKNKIFLVCHESKDLGKNCWFIGKGLRKEEGRTSAVICASDEYRIRTNDKDEVTSFLFQNIPSLVPPLWTTDHSRIPSDSHEGAVFYSPVIGDKVIIFEHGEPDQWYAGFSRYWQGGGMCPPWSQGKTRTEALRNFFKRHALLNINLIKELYPKEEDLIKELYPKEEESLKMSTEKDRKQLAKDQLKKAGSALLEGAGMATIDAGGEVMLDFAKEKFGDSPFVQAALSTQEGREFVKMFMAMVVQTVAYQTDMPKGEYAMRIAEKQLTLSGYKVLAPHLKDLMNLILHLGSLGENLDDPIAAFAPASESLKEAQKEKELIGVK